MLGLRLAFVADDTVEATPGWPEFRSMESRRWEKSRQEAHSGLIISYPTCVALSKKLVCDDDDTRWILLQEAARFPFPTFLLWNSSRGIWKVGTVLERKEKGGPCTSHGSCKTPWSQWRKKEKEREKRNSTTGWLGLSPRIWHPVTIGHCRISAKRCFFWLGLLLHEGYKHTNSSNLESQGRSRPLIRSAARRSQKRMVISIMSNGDIRKICSLIDKHCSTSLPGRSSGEP